MWGLVIVAGFIVWRSNGEDVEAPTDRLAGAILESPQSADSSPESTSATEPIVLTPHPPEQTPEQGWDPEGIEDFEFTERSGRKIAKSDLLGRPWAVSFIFTTCAGPCLGISAQMKALADQLEEEDVRFVTITVNPDYDTPEVLSNYADAFGADAEKWLFLTGDKRDIYGMIHGSFKMPVKEMQGADRKPGWEVLHTMNILLVDAQGRVVDKFNGTSETDMVELRRSLERLAASNEDTLTDEEADPAEDL